MPDLYLLAVTPETFYEYHYNPETDELVIDRFTFETSLSAPGVGSFPFWQYRIKAVYDPGQGYGGRFHPCKMLHICQGLGEDACIWKREDAKEMTVDQISEALGYKVKVVGNVQH
jgi:hypothetical protein